MDIYKKMCDSRVIILVIITIILLIIIYKLYYQKNDKYNTMEHFGILKNLKSKKKSKNNFKNIPKTKNTKDDISFDELVKSSENFSKEKDKLSNITDSILNYKNSFKHSKFKNNSASTAEAFEKFGLYKEKFLEIFN
jgi:hypothetical protein